MAVPIHSHQLCRSVSFPPHFLQHLLMIDFLMIVILNGVKWYLIVVLVSISLIVSDVELLFICLLAICIYSLERYLFRSMENCSCVFFFFFLISHPEHPGCEKPWILVPRELRFILKERFQWDQSFTSSHTYKSAKFLNLGYLVLINNHILMFRLPILCCKTSI